MPRGSDEGEDSQQDGTRSAGGEVTSESPIVVLVEFDPNRTSLNQPIHFRERHRRNLAANEFAKLGWMKAGKPRFNGLVVADVLVRRGRALDQDNILTGLKPVLDGLVRCGMLEGDSATLFRWRSVDQETGKAWRGREECIITLEGDLI